MEDTTSWATRLGALGMAVSAPFAWLWPEVVPRVYSLAALAVCTVVFVCGLARQRMRREGPNFSDADL
jgi:hypothetical protein